MSRYASRKAMNVRRMVSKNEVKGKPITGRKRRLALADTISKNKNYRAIIKFKSGGALSINFGPFEMSRVINGHNCSIGSRVGKFDPISGMTLGVYRKWGGGFVQIPWQDVQHIEWGPHSGLGPDQEDLEEASKWDEIIEN